MKINVSAGLGSYLAILGKIPLFKFLQVVGRIQLLVVTGLRSLFPWYIAFFIFKPTILMLQTCDFPFCHICLTPARENSLLLLAQVIRLDPLENQVNLILKYTAWLIFAKALSLCNIIYWCVPEIRPQTSQHGVWRRRFCYIYFCFIDYAKAFDCVDHNKLWKILKEMGIPDLPLEKSVCRSGSNS